MSVAELRRELMGLHHQLGAKSPSTLRKVEVQRLIPIYKDIIARQSSTPLPKETHHLPPREITETATTSEGIEVPVVPPKRETTDRKKPTKAKDIVIVHESGDAEKVEVKPAHIKKEKVKVEKVEKPAEPAPEKKKRVMTEEHKAKMKAGRDALKAKKAAETGGVSPPPAEPKEKPTKPTEPPAPVPAAKLPSGVRPLA
jgi:hypothetical protein